jgi:hypothetical protein
VRPWVVSLRAILLTHAHRDHVSGLPDFPGVPVWITRPEHEFIRPGGRWQFGATLPGVHYEEYGFEDGPYLGFPASHDIYGDGAIAVVPAPGHTPGSVIIFVTLHDGTRYAFVDDLVWQLEGITECEERPWASEHSDSDAAGTRANLLQMIAIQKRLPRRGRITWMSYERRLALENPSTIGRSSLSPSLKAPLRRYVSLSTPPLALVRPIQTPDPKSPDAVADSGRQREKSGHRAGHTSYSPASVTAQNRVRCSKNVPPKVPPSDDFAC